MLKQDLINDKKGLENLLCPLECNSHGIYCLFALYVREAPWSSSYSSSAMVQKVAVLREFEVRLHHAATGKLSLSSQQKMGTFFELGKDKAAKGEGWALPFISCAQDTVRL